MRRPFASHSYPQRGCAEDEHDWSRQRPYEKITRVSDRVGPITDDYLVRTTWVYHLGEVRLESAWSCVWRDDGVDRGRYYPYPLPVSAGGLEEAHNALVARVQAGELP